MGFLGKKFLSTNLIEKKNSISEMSRKNILLALYFFRALKNIVFVEKKIMSPQVVGEFFFCCAAKRKKNILTSKKNIAPPPLLS